jgi:hypothetical protein
MALPKLVPYVIFEIFCANVFTESPGIARSLDTRAIPIHIAQT